MSKTGTSSEGSTRKKKDLLSEYPDKNINLCSVIFEPGDREIESSKDKISIMDLFAVSKDDVVIVPLKNTIIDYDKIPVAKENKETKKTTKKKATSSKVKEEKETVNKTTKKKNSTTTRKDTTGER